jgi:quinolinate synthase
MTTNELAERWFELFNRNAGDLYPGRYTIEKCRELAEMAREIKSLAASKGSKIAVHNYLLPEFHEIGDYVGDSLGLALNVRDSGARRVDFESVHFMGATAKIILGDSARVYNCDTPQELGCSLVFGTDHAWVERWRARNPGGILCTYVNSDVYTKSNSDYVTTSRNTGMIIAEALRKHPESKILVLPDKYLGYVMKSVALEEFPEAEREALGERVEIYMEKYGGFNASCYVHEQIGNEAPEQALDEHPDAELMIHPECGCASSCLFKLNAGILPRGRVYYLSTEQMLWRARKSERKEFVVATEKGMLYRLRKELPEKTFFPVSDKAECRFMKANTFEKLLRSLREDRVEIVLCEDCCDPRKPFQDEKVVHIPKFTAFKAKLAIDRMMDIR